MRVVMRRKVIPVPGTVVRRLLRGVQWCRDGAAEAVCGLAEGWHLAPYDPNQLLKLFTRIRLREGFRLASYQCVTGGNANGFVFVIPDGRSLPPPSAAGTKPGWCRPGAGVPRSRSEGTLPSWACTDVESYLEGEYTPLSLFEASLFSREVRELGALWHGVRWGDHSLTVVQRAVPSGEWQWLRERPKDWRPNVEHCANGTRTVRFFTHTDIGRRQIIRHTDVYTHGYAFESAAEVIADGGPGRVP